MFLYLFYLKKYGIYIGCILFFYYYGDVNIEIYLVELDSCEFLYCRYNNSYNNKGLFFGEFWGI